MDYREKTVHGNDELPLAVYEITPEHSRYRMDAHWHPELEIMFIEKGSAVYRQGPQNLTLHVNDILITPPNTIHGLQAYNAELLARYMVIAPEAISMPPTHVFQKEFVAGFNFVCCVFSHIRSTIGAKV